MEDYAKDASDLIAKMADLHRRLISLDGFRMSESDDDLESYWGMSNELTAHARHILQSGELRLRDNINGLFELFKRKNAGSKIMDIYNLI